MAPISIEVERDLREHIRKLGGMVGAESLMHTVGGVSRRRAALVKADVVTTLERERQAGCARVRVTRPGVVRGFDAMYLEQGVALISADACIPYRTSAVAASRYDGEHVAEALDADFKAAGAPLVWRRDRARCHSTPAVVSVLREHRVLALSGPAYYAPYYGQLERQNREHRTWLDNTPDADHASLATMRSSLNSLWRRPTLGWRTAHEGWEARPPVDDDREQLHHEVEQRAACLRARGVAEDLAMRLAIEQALINRGYLDITPGRKVLRE